MPKNNPDLLPYKWRKAIEALILHPHLRSAATFAGIELHTLRRWIALPAFQDEYRRMADLHFGVISSQAQTMVLTGLETLVKNATNGETTDSRTRAADALCRHGFRAAELISVLDRLASIERQLAARSQESASVPSLMDRLNGLPTPGSNGTNGKGNTNGHANGNGKH